MFPAVVELFYLAFYPILVAGLLLIRHSTPGRDLASLADASIIVIGLGLLSWVFLISPYIWSEGLTPGQRPVSIAYPLGDVLVLAVAARLAIGTSNRPATWWLLTGSIVPLLFGDAVFVSLQVSNAWGTWQHQQLLDLCWILFYVGFGTAALHPSMVTLSEPTPVTVRLSRARLLLVGSACLLPSAILGVQTSRGRESVPTVIALAAGSAALFLLALVRVRGSPPSWPRSRNASSPVSGCCGSPSSSGRAWRPSCTTGRSSGSPRCCTTSKWHGSTSRPASCTTPTGC